MRLDTRRTAEALTTVLLVSLALVVAMPELAGKPLAVLERPITTRVSAVPISFDRDHPERIKPLRTEAERDAEGLALASGDTRAGSAYVSFEREHRILRYPFDTDRQAIPLPKEARAMGANQGIEALALIRVGPLKGTLVALAERLTDPNGNLKGWMIGGPSPGAITVRRLGGFDITGAAGLPDGGLVLLERRFRYAEGVQMRIRRIDAAELRPGRLIAGEVLLEATDRLNIDNMEAIAVHRSREGETILTLMSDDNFSLLQRSLIMQFSLP